MNKKPLHPRMGQIRRKGASRGFMTWVIHGDEQDVFWCVCQMLINRNPGGPKDISLDMRTGFGPMYWDPWWSRITANLPTVSSENQPIARKRVNNLLVKSPCRRQSLHAYSYGIHIQEQQISIRFREVPTRVEGQGAHFSTEFEVG